MTIQADLLAALDYLWSGTDAGTWVASDPALNGVLINSPTVDATGLSSQRLLATTSKFSYAPGNATTHRMASCTWVVRLRRINTDFGAVIKIGFQNSANPRNFAEAAGWGFGFGGGTFDSAGDQIIYLREQIAWHPFGNTYTPAVGVFASFAIRLTATGSVVHAAENLVGSVVGLPTIRVSAPYIQFGGYEAQVGLNRFSSVKILDVMQFTRDLTSDERLWLADENNSLVGSGASSAAAVHFFTFGF